MDVETGLEQKVPLVQCDVADPEVVLDRQWLGSLRLRCVFHCDLLASRSCTAACSCSAIGSSGGSVGCNGWNESIVRSSSSSSCCCVCFFASGSLSGRTSSSPCGGKGGSGAPSAGLAGTGGGTAAPGSAPRSSESLHLRLIPHGGSLICTLVQVCWWHFLPCGQATLLLLSSRRSRCRLCSYHWRRTL